MIVSVASILSVDDLFFQDGHFDNNLFSFIIFYVQYAIILIQLIISFFSDQAVFETDEIQRLSKFDERSSLLGCGELQSFVESMYARVSLRMVKRSS